MTTQLYCDCETGVEAHSLHEKGWVYIPNSKPHRSACRKCMDTGVIPTVYCTCTLGDFRHALDFGGPITVNTHVHCEICMGGGVIAGGRESWVQSLQNVEKTTPGGTTYQDQVRIIQRVVQAPRQPVEELTSLGVARLRVAQREMAHLVEGDGLVDFEAALAARDLEDDLSESLPQAVVEVVWGEKGFKTAFSMLKCPDGEATVLLPPETARERFAMLRNLRWVINYMALKWGLSILVREEDWGDDKRG